LKVLSGASNIDIRKIISFKQQGELIDFKLIGYQLYFNPAEDLQLREWIEHIVVRSLWE